MRYYAYREGGEFLRNQYGAGTGQIWLDNLQCVGEEASLGLCQHRGWGIHNCGHSEDVSILCNEASLTTNGYCILQHYMSYHASGFPQTRPLFRPLSGVRAGFPKIGRMSVLHTGTRRSQHVAKS